MALDLVSSSLMEIGLCRLILPRLEDCCVFTIEAGDVTNLIRVAPMTKKRKHKDLTNFPVINPDAAGVDVGATDIFVAVPPERSDTPVRHFPTFTADLQELADWLIECRVTTVAMESTGVYWIPLFQILEERNIEVCLVNARQLKNVDAHKTDVRDSCWLRNLHAVGLLRASFRPEQAVCRVRTIVRHRDGLTKCASKHVQHMQKALNQMNILLHHVLTDITGVSGLAILDAILAGERDPVVLAQLCHSRVKASEETIKKALTGDWREEHLFTLRQSLASWRHFQQQIAENDAQIARLLSEYEPIEDAPDPPSRPKRHKTRKTTQPPSRRRTMQQECDQRDQMIKLFGVNLAAIPGIAANSVQLLFTELGRDLSRFPTASHFASYLGLSPDNRISGNKILSAKTRRVKCRAAMMFRMAANSLERSDCHLGRHLRRMKSKLGKAAGITATAHKLARIVFHLVTNRVEYDDTIFARREEQFQQSKLNSLKRQAEALGFEFVKRECVS